jgi:hypothetical protein
VQILCDSSPRVWASRPWFLDGSRLPFAGTALFNARAPLALIVSLYPLHALGQVVVALEDSDCDPSRRKPWARASPPVPAPITMTFKFPSRVLGCAN